MAEVQIQLKRKTPRNISITKNINPYADGSVIVEYGQTKVHVTAMVEEKVPPFLKGKGEGWVTAEYSMLPASSQTRIERETKGPKGRTQEIQRLIGRSLRAAIDLKDLGERSILIDCDVLVADGGTRTASITGGYVALALAVKNLMKKKILIKNPLHKQVAAISVGINKANEIIADLNYQEDSTCSTDMNIVMTSQNEFIEVQGTAEGMPFSHDQLMGLLECARSSLEIVFAKQNEILAD